MILKLHVELDKIDAASIDNIVNIDIEVNPESFGLIMETIKKAVDHLDENKQNKDYRGCGCGQAYCRSCYPDMNKAAYDMPAPVYSPAAPAYDMPTTTFTQPPVFEQKAPELYEPANVYADATKSLEFYEPKIDAPAEQPVESAISEQNAASGISQEPNAEI